MFFFLLFDSSSPRQFIDIAQIRSQPLPLAVLPSAHAPAKDEAAVLTGLQVQNRILLLNKLALDVGSDQFLVSLVHLCKTSLFVHACT
jgi:hypothetical protein